MAGDDTSIGRLRWPVYIATRQQAADPNSPGFVESLANTLLVHANIQPIGMMTFYAGMQVDTPVTHRITVRWLDWIDTTCVIYRQTLRLDKTSRVRDLPHSPRRRSRRTQALHQNGLRAGDARVNLIISIPDGVALVAGKKQLTVVMRAVGNEVAQSARASIRAGAATKKRKAKRQSTPGQPPVGRTGLLASSLRVKMSFNGSRVTISDVARTTRRSTAFSSKRAPGAAAAAPATAQTSCSPARGIREVACCAAATG